MKDPNVITVEERTAYLETTEEGSAVAALSPDPTSQDRDYAHREDERIYRRAYEAATTVQELGLPLPAATIQVGEHQVRVQAEQAPRTHEPLVTIHGIGCDLEGDEPGIYYPRPSGTADEPRQTGHPPRPDEQDTWTLQEGERVRFKEPLERFPHFTVPAGETGTVAYIEEDHFAIKLDRKIKGAEEWDNEAIIRIEDGTFLTDEHNEMLHAAQTRWLEPIRPAE